MSGLGNARWLNDYIGIPYTYGGRSMAGVDCFGLAILIYKNEYGIDLPDWYLDEVDLTGRHEAISSVVCSGSFEETDEPKDGDFAFCYRTRMAHHVGLHFARGIIHAESGLGVVYVPRSRFERDYVKVVYGDWTP